MLVWLLPQKEDKTKKEVRRVKVLLTNAFSIQMLKSSEVEVSFRKVEAHRVTAVVHNAARTETEFVSAIGHADTAAVVGSTLGLELEANRENIALEENDVLFVAQLKGGRLPEGSTTLPEGFNIEFWQVQIIR
ncbi:hypothetical protein COZ22_03425 [bacterium (Candidatus Howlettbacteria) CG_4_10_14_3_um_filter_37_10]|nr:MAG: hypothetical protein COZ22_03425 [bacterium (Candidatus Howlettbacteria) CG_4_10_14_3_um_filter_37_10]